MNDAPAFTPPTPIVYDELMPKCWPIEDGIRVNNCPMTYEWFTRLMKLESQLSH